LYAIVKWMPVEKMAQIVSRYPLSVLAAFKDWSLRMEWNVDVSVSMGGSQIKSAKDQNAMAKFQSGLQTKESSQIEMNIDPAQEHRREEAELQRQQKMMQKYAPPPVAAPPPVKEK
jgi:hypothetical protein